MKKSTTSSLALASAVVAALGACKDDGSGSGTATPEMEKCYGIAKAGKNDCASKVEGTSCAGSSKVDGDKNAWMFIPKGLCSRIVGGTLEAGDGGEEAMNCSSSDCAGKADEHADGADCSGKGAANCSGSHSSSEHAWYTSPRSKTPELV